MSVKHNIEFKNMESSEEVEKLIGQLISKLEKRARNFSSDIVFLRIFVEENETRTLYRVSLTLQVPRRVLAAKAESHDLRDSLRDVFAEIDRQLRRHKSNLRGESSWKRKAKREELREMRASTEPGAQRSREAFFALVNPHLKRLYQFMQHVIGYSEMMGDILPEELTPEEVADGALVRAYRDFLSGRSIRDVKNWLIRIAIDELDAQINQWKVERERSVAIETDIPETTSEEDMVQEEMFEFYQPDEDLKLEDVIPDPKAMTPEQELEEKERSDPNRRVA